MKLGVYSLVTPDYQIAEAAELIAEIGYDTVEWTVDYPRAVWDGESKWHINTEEMEATTKAAREAAESNGLEIPSLGTRCNCLDLDGVRVCMDAAKRVGAAGIRVGVPRYDGKMHYDELFQQARKGYAEVAKLAGEMGVKALIETHHGLITPTASATLRVLEGLDPECVGVLYDPGNMVHEGMEQYKMGMQMLRPFLHHVHAKNAGWVRKDGKWVCEWMSLQDGMVNWQVVFDALKEVGYDGAVNIEDFRGGYACKPVGITTQDKLQEDHDYLRSLL
jgi:sugar phosphate isomerase/epimerase